MAKYVLEKSVKNQISIYLLEGPRLSRIQPNQWFLGRSCQNELMRSNNFDLKYSTSMCREVEVGQRIKKIRPHAERISKIPSRGERAWKNWFLVFTTFLDRAIFWSIISEKIGQKMTGTKNSQIPKKILFIRGWPVKEFLKLVWSPVEL